MPDVAERPDVLTLDNFIGGRWVKARASEYFTKAFQLREHASERETNTA